ncbi:hypothetical protein EI94DRAFT_1798400 [Lactarius quietus]|nr:hypothetical protein EI94DRAFT_1798400 [Lactarius quietus]
MSLFVLLICYFLRNGMTVDALGLILAGGAIIILMIGPTCRAVRVLAARLIIPAADLYLNLLVGGVPDQDLEVGEPAEPAEIEDVPDLVPDDPSEVDSEDDDFM